MTYSPAKRTKNASFEGITGCEQGSEEVLTLPNPWLQGCLGSPLPRPAPRLLEVHLPELAVASRSPVSTLAAVTRVSVLGAGVALTVAVDVA